MAFELSGKSYCRCCDVVKCKEPDCNNLITLQGWGNEKEFCRDCIKKHIREQQRQAYYKRRGKKN